jgi:adenylate cyclase
VYRVQTERSARASVSALPLPDKPSIAVLPFQNMSGDPEQEYFADGMVEEIISSATVTGWVLHSAPVIAIVTGYLLEYVGHT